MAKSFILAILCIIFLYISHYLYNYSDAEIPTTVSDFCALEEEPICKSREPRHNDDLNMVGCVMWGIGDHDLCLESICRT